MEKDDDSLGLSLCLGFGSGQSSQSSLKFNLMQQQQQQQKEPLDSLHKSLHDKQKSSLHDLFPTPVNKNSEMRSFLPGIDMNRLPSMVVDGEDDNGVSSPNSTISSVSGKRSGEREEQSCSHGSDDEDGSAARKKLRLTKEQAMVLEETFDEYKTLNPKQKQALAQRLNLRPRQVEVWFQNRRARTKLKQTEVDCAYLKRCCENLTEENRRLQKEVQELRTLKLSPQLYMHMNPPTTLTMCPSCERVAVTQSSGASAVASSSVPRGMSHQNSGSKPQQPVPIGPWAALPVSRRPV